jgi:hypothetical protein
LITVIEVVRSNTAQKGTITVGKSGEVFSTVSGTKGLYQPIFSVAGLEGAVYEITAAEDIYTLDGTLRASKGEWTGTATELLEALGETETAANVLTKWMNEYRIDFLLENHIRYDFSRRSSGRMISLAVATDI